jgi:hypothetical protein
MAAPTFIRIRVSPAKAAISSDRVIAEELTGAWLPCQERSASQRPARSNYPLNTEFPRASRRAADARPRPSARNVHFGSDSAVRFGRAARQLHPHQQTFATTIKSSHSGPMLSTSTLDRFIFLQKNRVWAGRDRSPRSHRRCGGMVEATPFDVTAGSPQSSIESFSVCCVPDRRLRGMDGRQHRKRPKDTN